MSLVFKVRKSETNMKPATVTLLFWFCMTSSLFVGCVAGPKGSSGAAGAQGSAGATGGQGTTGAQGTSGIPGTPGTQAAIDGGSSGGGSFGNESALTILRWAADDLSQQILNSSPEIYANLPKGWTQARLAQIIHDVEPTEKDLETYKVPEVVNYGQRLMFHYGMHKDGSPYITATRLFTDAYASAEVNTKPKESFRATIDQVKLKLIHETAHLMGLGLSKETDMPQARAFAQAVLDSLDSDNVECLPKADPPKDVFTAFEIKDYKADATGALTFGDCKIISNSFPGKMHAYVFNRPSGRAAQPSNVYSECDKSGQPTNKPESEERLYVFAPVDYTSTFELTTIRQAIEQNQRTYSHTPGYFNWNLIDRRNAVLTDQGYKSADFYDNSTTTVYDSNLGITENNNFSDYMDYKVLQSSAQTLLLESYPPAQQEVWSYYRTQGKSQIALTMAADGNIQDAHLILLKSYNVWLDPKVTAPDLHLDVPLECRRSFKPLPELPALAPK